MLRKILFVDDDQILRCAVEKHLETFRDHFTTVTASDGFEALQKLKKMPFSLVVLDLIMPRMDGMSLINHMRDNYPDIPIIVISGMPAAKMQHLTEAYGVVTCLSKPFQADELVRVIMKILRAEAAGGIMHDVSPSVFLQFMEMDAKTCTIRVLDKVSKQGGILYFIDGQLLDVRIGEQKGIDAALRLFTWDTTTMFLRNECQPRKDNINSGLQPIIMKAAGMKDEAEEVVLADGDAEPFPTDSFDALGDLDLPVHLQAAQVSGRPENTGSSRGANNAQSTAGANPDDLRKFLEKTAGIICSDGDFRQDTSIDNIAMQLQKLGSSSHFGSFQVGYITSGSTSDHLLIPGSPATLVTIKPGGPRDTLLETLRTKTENS